MVKQEWMNELKPPIFNKTDYELMRTHLIIIINENEMNEIEKHKRMSNQTKRESERDRLGKWLPNKQINQIGGIRLACTMPLLGTIDAGNKDDNHHHHHHGDGDQ